MSLIKGTKDNNTLIGTDAADQIYGFEGDDVLDGGFGDDSFDGGAGNDTYVFGRGSGQDTIFDYDDTLVNSDTIQFAAGIAPADVAISLDASNLYVKINGTDDQLMLSNWFTSDAYKIEQVKFSNGILWDVATLSAKINGFTPSLTAFASTAAVFDVAADTTAPTVTITDNLPGTANKTTNSLVYTLAFSESVTGLETNDFTVANGTVNSVSGSGSLWTVNVIPSPSVSAGTIDLTLKAGAVSDGAGNINAAVTNSSQAIDTKAPVAPKLVTNAAFNFLVDPQVTMQTSQGTVVFELNPEQAPVTVANMLAYANIGFYDNTLFHRVIPGFMVQGGGLTSGLFNKTPDYDPIVLESNNGLSNLRGTIAMARTNVANSATSQFYVNLVDNAFLNYSNPANPGYAVFGKVVSGMAVIDGIARVPTTTVGPYQNVPAANVTITSIQQTLAGSSITNVGKLTVSGLETGAQWFYSLDSGATWTAGFGNSLTVPAGNYEASAIQVIQTDSAGNTSVSAGKLTSSLIVDNLAPTLTGLSPDDGATAVSIGSNIVLTFSETTQAGTGNIIIYNADGTVAQTILVSDSSQVSISGSTVTVNPNTNLTAGGSSYYVTISTGAFKDLAGNSFAGITGTTAYNFTTVNEVPTLTAFGSAVAGGDEDSEITVTLTDLKNQGDASDADGTVDSFVIKTLNSGSLKIGTSAGTATAWATGTNEVIDATHHAYWTPDANANGVLNAFTAAAKDNAGAESAVAVQAAVAVTAMNEPLIFGTPGNDTLLGDVGSNAIYGMEGDDLLYGNGSSDLLEGGEGNDTLCGGQGNDTLNGGNGNDIAVFSGTFAGYHLSYGAGVITVIDTGPSEDNDGTDTLTQIETLRFADRDIDGLRYIASYSDLINAFHTNATAGLQHYAEYGISEGRSASFDPEFYLAKNGDLRALLGTDFNAATAYYINHFPDPGHPGTNTGNDILNGSDSADTLNAGSGDDVLNGNAGNDTLNGGDGNDMAVFSGAFAGYQLHYSAGGIHLTVTDTLGNDGTDTLTQIETLRFADRDIDGLRYIASYGDLINAFHANAVAGLQHYAEYGASEGRSASFDPEFYLAKYPDLRAAFGNDLDAAARYYIEYGFGEGLTATNTGNDILNGSDSADTLNAGTGDDVLKGNAGNDTLNGGDGNDMAVFSGAFAGYQLHYTAGGIHITVTDTLGNGGTDTLAQIETLRFADRDIDGLRYIASYGDLINAFHTNAVAGLQHYAEYGASEGRSASFDPEFYLAKNGDLRALLGTDLNAATAYYINHFPDSGHPGTNTGNDILNGPDSADTLNAGPGDDVLNGNAGNDSLSGDAGNDSLNGGDGNDTAVFGGAFAGYQLHYSAGGIHIHITVTDTLGNGGTDTLTQIETLRFADRDINGLRYIASYGDLINAFHANAVAGLQHYAEYGAGEGRSASFDPEFYLAKYADLRAAFGNDLDAATRHYINTGFGEGLNVSNAGNDILTGDANANRLDGGTGADTLIGGSGNDVYVVDNAGDGVIETSTMPGEMDTVVSSITYTLGVNLENLILTAPPSTPAIPSAATINFNPGMNFSSYAGMANVAPVAGGGTPGTGSSGGYYEDGMVVGIVEDTSNPIAHLHRAGTAADRTLSYHADSSGIYIRSLDSKAFSLDAMDFMAPINATAGNPDSGANDFWDILGFNTALNPGLDLGTGDCNDYTACVAYQKVANGFNGILSQGNGSLNSGFNNINAVWIHFHGYLQTPTDGKEFSMALDNIQVSPIEQAAPVNGTGNELDNVINGSAGDKTLDGGSGHDVLTGGPGQDIFKFMNLSNDTITDFSVADDTLHFENSVFTQLTTGVLNADNFHTGSAAADANDYLIYDNGTGALFYDADGNGAGAATQIALLGSNLALTAADFFVI